MASVTVSIQWNSAAVRALGQDATVRALMDRLTAFAVQDMKKNIPVSPVGPLHRSGTLRSSVRSFRQADGSVLVGPTASYGGYVNDGTPPHVIRSTGPWPLRNPETGQVFGPVVHHPGTKAVHFIERTAADIAAMKVVNL
jgi:hypothetical protein